MRSAEKATFLIPFFEVAPLPDEQGVRLFFWLFQAQENSTFSIYSTQAVTYQKEQKTCVH